MKISSNARLATVFLTAGLLWAFPAAAENWGGRYRDAVNGFTVLIEETGIGSGIYTTSDGDWGQWYEDPANPGEIVFLGATPPYDTGRARAAERDVEGDVLEFDWRDDGKPGKTPGGGTARRVR